MGLLQALGGLLQSDSDRQSGNLNGLQRFGIALDSGQQGLQQVQAGQMQNDQQRQMLAQLANLRQSNASPLQVMSSLAGYSPEIAEKAATLQAQNPLASFGQPTATQQTAPIGGVDPQADPSLPWSGATQTPAQTNSPPQIYSPESPDDKRNYKFLSTLPPAVQGLVKGLSDGDENSGAQAFKSPMSLSLQAFAKQFDPSFSQTAYTARNTMAKSIGGGKIYDISTAANKAIPHSAALLVAHEEQGNGNAPMINSIVNGLGQAAGGTANTNFNAVKTTFVPEMAKFTAGAGGSTESDRQELNDNFSPNMSDKQLSGALSKKVTMGLDATKSVEDDASKVMGRKISLLTPENQQLAKDIQDYSGLVKSGLKQTPIAQTIYSRIKGSVSAAPQQPSVAIAQSDQANIREGQTATNPQTGHKMVFKAGQWVGQ